MPLLRQGNNMNNKSYRTGFFATPPRESILGSVLVLLATGVMSIGFVIPGGGGVTAVVVAALILSVSALKRDVFAIHLTLFTLLMVIPSLLGATLNQWPFGILAPLLIYGLIVIIVPGLRKSLGWLKKGRTDANVMKWVLATSVLSAIALLGWVILIKPDIGHHVAQIPNMPLWLYPLAGLGFAILNATMEEAVFRGIVMEALDGALGDNYISVGIQAVPFAAFHYLVGFPKGLVGFLMVLIYGVMLGVVRRVSKGMLAPLMAHVAADMTIFLILVVIYFR